MYQVLFQDFIAITVTESSKQSYEIGNIIIPIYRWENWSTEIVVKQHAPSHTTCGRNGIQTQAEAIITNTIKLRISNNYWMHTLCQALD